MTQPTDADLIAYLERHPGSGLRALCAAFDLPYAVSRLGFVGRYGYTKEARSLAGQLQRLRRQGKLKTLQGQKWEVRTP